MFVIILASVVASAEPGSVHCAINDATSAPGRGQQRSRVIELDIEDAPKRTVLSDKKNWITIEKYTDGFAILLIDATSRRTKAIARVPSTDSKGLEFESFAPDVKVKCAPALSPNSEK